MVQMSIIRAQLTVELVTDRAVKFYGRLSVELALDSVFHLRMEAKVSINLMALLDPIFVEDASARLELVELTAFVEVCELRVAPIAWRRRSSFLGWDFGILLLHLDGRVLFI